jgi:hypothetical protein
MIKPWCLLSKIKILNYLEKRVKLSFSSCNFTKNLNILLKILRQKPLGHAHIYFLRKLLSSQLRAKVWMAEKMAKVFSHSLKSKGLLIH